MERSFRLMGAVTRPHGVRGEVKVRPETDDPGRFTALESVFLGADESSLVQYSVTSVAMQPHGADVTVLLGLESVLDRDAAERLSGSLVWADEAELPALEEGEFFLGDLVGMEAVDVDGTAIGRVEDVLELPAQPVLVIARPDGRQILFPLVDEFVESVDPDEGVLVLRPIEGLIDPDDQEVAE